MESLNVSNFHEQESNPLLAGAEITLVKIDVNEKVGGPRKKKMGFIGILENNIVEGSPVQIKGISGGRTSFVQKIYKKDGRLFVDTQNSTYEIILNKEQKAKKDFEGLKLKNDLGEISLPIDAMEAKLDNDVINAPKLHVYINKKLLKNILLEVHGGEIFMTIEDRFVVLTKVHNIHLPFYISSEGTSGKRKGEWYPFFGYNGHWLVKGSVDVKKGDMVYHPAITEVQNLLNHNLIIPQELIQTSGKIIDENNNTQFDLNRCLKFQYTYSTEYSKYNHPNLVFLERITGYKPQKVTSNNVASVDEWIKDIVSHIK